MGRSPDRDRRARMMEKLISAGVTTVARNYALAIWNSYGWCGRDCWESQEALAKLHGVDQGTVRRWERAVERAGGWSVIHEPGRGRRLHFCQIEGLEMTGDPVQTGGATPGIPSNGPRALVHANNKTAGDSINSSGAVGPEHAEGEARWILLAVEMSVAIGVTKNVAAKLAEFLKTRVEQLSSSSRSPGLIVRDAFLAVLALAKSRPDPGHRPGFLVAALGGKRVAVFDEKLDMALKKARQAEEASAQSRERERRMHEPRVPPPDNLMAMLKQDHAAANARAAAGIQPEPITEPRAGGAPRSHAHVTCRSRDDGGMASAKTSEQPGAAEPEPQNELADFGPAELVVPPEQPHQP